MIDRFGRTRSDVRSRATSRVVARCAAAQRVATRLAAACLLAMLPGAVHGQAAPIFVDGTFGDWTGVVENVDPAGDGGSSGIDLRDVDLANDDANLFIRFVVTAEIILQEQNNHGLELYLDTDVNAATGLSIGGIGAELQWRFSDKQGSVYTSGGAGTTVFQNDIRARQLPSVSSPVFEISIGRDVVPGGITLFPGPAVRVLLLDSDAGGDRAPNAGMDLIYNFDSTPVGPPTPIPLERDSAGDTRFVTWNVRDLASGDSFNAGPSAEADRVLSALAPEVICFQELFVVTAAQTANLVEGFLPSGPGESWHAAKERDNIVVSRFPILDTWAVDRNLAVLLDTDAVLGSDVLLVNAHLPCCSNNLSRQAECDGVMQFFRDAMTAGGVVTVPAGTILMLTGDLNLVGFSQQLTTLLTGDILDNGTYGPDFAPDWDGTDFADVVSRQTEMRYAYTWRNDSSSFAPGRLDFFIYSDSAVDLAKSFILYTPEMSSDQLAQYALLASSVPGVSDHLPHVADFRVTPTGVGNDDGGHGDAEHDADRAAPANAPLRVAAATAPDQAGMLITITLEVDARLRLDVYDVRGALVRALHRPGERVFPSGEHTLVWDGRGQDGRRAASGTYLLRATATSPRDGANDGTRALGLVSTKLLLLRP